MRGWYEKKLPSVSRRQSYLQVELGFHRFDDHVFKQDLKRHGMSAAFMGKKKLTIAVENTVIISNMMLAIIAMKIKIKLVEMEAMPVLCVSFCLFYLAYQSRIHCSISFFGGI